jgi:membrane protease YdiL (CAAX protease family)
MMASIENNLSMLVNECYLWVGFDRDRMAGYLFEFVSMKNIKYPADALNRGARRLVEFVLLLFAVAAIGVAAKFVEGAFPIQFGPGATALNWAIRNLSTMCLSMVISLWMLAFINRGHPMKTLFQVRARMMIGLVAGAVVSIAVAALLVDFEAIRSNGFHPINPTVHPQIWTVTLTAMLLGVLFEELFHRALLQTLISRLFGNEVAGLVGAAAIFTVMHPLKDAVLVIPGALLFGVVFWRTRSVFCTTALHLAMNVTIDLLKGRTLMVSPLLSPEEFAPMKPAIGLALIFLTIAFELGHRRAERRKACYALNDSHATIVASSALL